ncbi:MAG: RNA 2',3'-cyclic phosphodiesterase [Candidatus Heimdallarchaeaceae archaeon]
MARIFIAIDFDDEEIKKNIQSVQKELDKTNNALKLVNPEIIHLTLAFLGEQTDERVKEVEKILEEIDFSPMKLRLQGIGVFPNMNYIRVIYTEVMGDVEILEGIHKSLKTKLKSKSFKLDSKPFKPHVTIARVKNVRNKENLRLTLNKFQSINIGAMEITSIKLKQSFLRPQGPEYTTLYEKKAI